MICDRQGDLFSANAAALVNPVNCVGVMGRGVALAVKRRFPESFKRYATACAQGEVCPGRVFVTEEAGLTLLHFPTKRHWREAARPNDIRAGLVDLVRIITERHLESVALPALGCGLGGLDWEDVHPMIVGALAPLSSVMFFLYGPHREPPPIEIPGKSL